MTQKTWGKGNNKRRLTHDPSNLPTVEEMMEELREKDEYAETLEILAEAYYNAGLDYREKLSDPEEAINIWQDLLERLIVAHTIQQQHINYLEHTYKGNLRAV